MWILSFISLGLGNKQIINVNIVNINISFVVALSLILFIGTSKRVGKTVAIALWGRSGKMAMVKQEVRVIYDRKVFVFRDWMRFRIFF